MIILSLSSIPSGLFKPISFRMGMNYVYGKKDAPEATASLNGIGKSCIFDLIDFCLLGDPRRNKRLQAISKEFSAFSICLKVKIRGEVFSITRSLSDYEAISIGGETATAAHDFDEAQEFLKNALFTRDGDEEFFDAARFRTLISFFVKLSRPGKGTIFSDAVQFTDGPRVYELIPYHAYLLGLPTKDALENVLTNEELSRQTAVKRQINDIFKKVYGIPVAQAQTETISDRAEIDQLASELMEFKLDGHYDEAGKKLDDVTQEIKRRSAAYFSIEMEARAIERELSFGGEADDDRIKEFYARAVSIFGDAVQRDLNEVINFRKRLAETRRSFYGERLDKLIDEARTLRSDVSVLDKSRSDLFRTLSEEHGLHDLILAYGRLLQKERDLSEKEGRIRIYVDAVNEEKRLKQASKDIAKRLSLMVLSFAEKIAELNAAYRGIAKAIYSDGWSDDFFLDISVRPRTKHKLSIDPHVPAQLSRGKARGAILLYDMSILLENYANEWPHFLAHDGIFDGMDKAHLVAIHDYIEDMARSGREIQYIVSLNEEGTLSERFGAEGDFNRVIEDIAVATLTPDSPLFGRKFG